MDTRRSRSATFVFTTLALGLSLLYWGLFFLHDRGLLPFDPNSELMGAIRGYGPTLAALVTAAANYGRVGLKELWLRLKLWRVRPWLLGLALLGPLLGSALLLILASIYGADLTPSPERLRARGVDPPVVLYGGPGL